MSIMVDYERMALPNSVELKVEIMGLSQAELKRRNWVNQSNDLPTEEDLEVEVLVS